ncbi:MAG: ribosome small subunit-dependent GTPase A, partial [Myxococcota bacterium]
MYQLRSMGFGPDFLAQLDLSHLSNPTGPPVGRIAFTAHGHARLLTPDGERAAILDGPLRHDPPVVGDWVWARPGDPFVLTRRFERRNTLRRRDPAGGAQVVAANVDVALICTALGRDLSA